jgi:hypothetical protein
MALSITSLGVCVAVQTQQLRDERRAGVNSDTLLHELPEQFGTGRIDETETRKVQAGNQTIVARSEVPAHLIDPRLEQLALKLDDAARRVQPRSCDSQHRWLSSFVLGSDNAKTVPSPVSIPVHSRNILLQRALSGYRPEP